ncbi:MAG: endopeptidase La [Labilithrix sp.]|nr:endopeptidase La [Labilithrix sp.]
MATESKVELVSIPDVLPVLPLQDTVLFPDMAAPILVGQPRSFELVNATLRADRLAAIVTQKNAESVPARPEELYRVGTMALLHELGRDAASIRLMAQGLARVRTVDYAHTEPYLVARVEHAPEPREQGVELDALVRKGSELFVRLVRTAAELSDDLAAAVEKMTDAKQLAYLIAAAVPLPTATRQEILELDAVSARLRRLVAILQHEISVRELIQRITSETAQEMNKTQREFILRKHMESIQKELGDVESGRAEVRALRERLEELPLSEDARKEASRELDRLERTPEASPEHGVIRTYVDWMFKLPWGKLTGARIDVERAREVLDQDHYDLERIKDRILDYLAVKHLREEREAEIPQAHAAPSGRARTRALRTEPILCFLGPPGVGKTSLGQSIARALGRAFVRQSLGGVHDEAEIRGHRRTYVGAMPGRIVQALARAGAADPVFMLDEIDKLGASFHGDPSAALLELLDPAQNHAFVDTYLGVPFDLSRVLFICTANTTETIPSPLLDRMEVLTLAGYTEQDKLQIATRYLLPDQHAANGLREGEVRIPDEAVLAVIRRYTREAGVRNLERALATILRKAARRITQKAPTPIHVGPDDLREYLGPTRFFDEVAERIDRPGVAAGLSWTPAGGDVLFVEASMVRGAEEKLILTGMLGSVMRESAEAALTYLRANADRLGVDPHEMDERRVVHVHVPAGAIPKDGPSAGITMLVALASHALGRAVHGDVAMTGEITLRGKVLPVGGVKEKVLAAHRADLRTVILPRRNEGDLEEVPEEVRRACRFVLAESVDEVLREALGVLQQEEAEARGAPPPPIH